MIPEINIVLYIAFIISLFVFESLTVYAFILIVLALLLFRLPWKKIKAGWLPISMFLLFTFISNLLNRQGRVLFSAGALLITEEGMTIASLRSLRVLFMIGGAKLLMASARPEEVINAMGRLMLPFEKIGLPVKDFFHTMGLTLKCFPVLKDAAMDTYKKEAAKGNAKGFRGRAVMISSLLLPMFVETVRSPELFFERQKITDD